MVFRMKLRAPSLFASSIAAFLLVSCSSQEPTLADPLDPPVADTLVVSPSHQATVVNTPVTFAVADTTMLGHAITGSVTWTASGGSIDTSGVFIADAEGTYEIHAERGGRDGFASVSVSRAVAPEPPGPPVTLTAIELTPTNISLAPGGTQQFAAIGRLSNGNLVTVLTDWVATGGTISSSGLFRAGSSAGTFRVIGTRHGDSQADTSVVTITSVPATLVSVQVSPAAISLNPGATQQFSAVGRNSDGSSSSISVSWSATGGSISSSGLYTAGSSAGSYRVIAVRQGDTKADTSSVTINVPAPTLTAIEVTPSTASVVAGATRQFNAVGRLSDNSTTSVAVTWSATGGTVSTSGLYTAGSTAGTFRVIAVRQGDTKADTASVTVTAAPATPPASPTLSSVVVTPASASLSAGATQQFNATGRMSDNTTTSVAVSWSATGGTVSSSGHYTAGSTAGSFRVIAVQQGGTKADTSTITVTASAPPVTVPPPPPSTGSTPNPSLLPLATGQTGVSPSAYTALPIFNRSTGQVGSNPRNMAAGQFYVDPAFGTSVIRLTSSSFPTSNGGAYLDYWEGGSRISYPWGAGSEWYTIKVQAGGYYLIDFNIRTYEVRNQRSVPAGAGELSSAFSLDPSTPQVLYTWMGSTIRKWNTATSPATEITGGGFPKSVPGSDGYWFSMSKNDEWFVSSSGSSSTSTIYAWRRSTNTVTSVVISGDYNEQKLDKSGRYVWVNRDGGIQIWDAQTGQLGPNRGFGSGGVAYQGHAGVGQGYAVGSNNSGASPWFWRTNMASLEAIPEFTSATPINPYEINNSAIWVSQAATSNQWYLATNTYGAPTYTGAKLQMAIGLVRMDASEARGVAHHYNTGSVGNYFGQYAWGNISPDGRLSAFVTNFNGGSRTDVMLVPTPTQ
jgi:hypothetical protein